MKKKFIGISLAALIALCGGFAINQVKEPSFTSEEKARDDLLLGQDVIQDIRKQYEEGQYNTFLKEMDEFYANILRDHRLQEFSALREGTTINPQWNAFVQKLDEEKNQQLIQAVSQDESVFGEKVRFVTSTISTPEEKEAFSKLFMFHHMPLGGGKNQDENALIAIDIEYECKTLHLNGMSNIDPRVGQYVLKMQQMDKMLLASESFEDQDLKNIVRVASQNADQRMAQNWDVSDLKALSQGKLTVKSPSQEQVVSILKQTQEKLNQGL